MYRTALTEVMLELEDQNEGYCFRMRVDQHDDGHYRRDCLQRRITDERGAEMSVIRVAGKAYGQVEYDSEADLQTAIIEVHHRLFGANRYYLDVKNRIGVKGSVQNIPDGYLLDLFSSKPRLYVVENELESHDPPCGRNSKTGEKDEEDANRAVNFALSRV